MVLGGQDQTLLLAERLAGKGDRRAYPVAILVLLFFALLGRSWASWRQKRHRDSQIALHSCEPAFTLARSPWLFGLDVAREMLSSYSTGSRNEQLTRKFREVRSTFRTESGSVGRIFTIDPKNLKSVFGGSGDCWGVAPVRHEAFSPLFDEGVLVSDGIAWRHSRTLAESVIERIFRDYTTCLDSLDDHINTLLSILPTKGSVIDLQPIFYQFTMDLSTSNMFGKSIGATKPGALGLYGKEFVRAFLHCLTMAGERDEVPQWSHYFYNRAFKKSCQIVHSYVDDNVRRAVAINTSTLVTAKSKSGEPGSWEWAGKDLIHARNHVLNVLAASFDTGAIFLTNLFFHLSRHPASYQKLRKEVLAFEGIPDVNTIKTMSYLQAVLSETLRLHGPASFNSRVALKDMIIPCGGGKDGTSPILVPKGDIVIVCQYALQRQHSIYGEDADVFRPERWDDIQPRYYEFLPFSGGSRVCPGQKLALFQAGYTLFRLVQSIEALESGDPVWEFIEEYRVATGSRNGALVKVTMAE